MLKVWHTGDLHLGMTHKSRNYPEDLRKQLVEARLQTLEQMVEQANLEECQLFVVAGDLFHSTNVGKEIVLKAAGALAGFVGSCVAVLPGNHDFYNEMSPLWKPFMENAADHILVLAEEKPYSLQDYGIDAILYPAPCERKHCEQNRLGWIAQLADKPEAKWHLGVAHGTVQGVSPDFDGRYFPMVREELLQLGMNHWFLGHSHVRLPEESAAENCGITFCGTPEPNGFDCRHGGYAWVVEIGEERVVSRAVQTGQFRFHEVEHNLRQLEDLQRLPADVVANGEQTLVKLTLHGMLSRQEYRDRFTVLKQLEEQFAYLEYDDGALELEVTSASIDEEFASGSFPHKLLSNLAQKDDHAALQMAYQLIKKVKK